MVQPTKDLTAWPFLLISYYVYLTLSTLVHIVFTSCCLRHIVLSIILFLVLLFFSVDFFTLYYFFFILTEIITDICSKPSRDFDFTIGILRSHRGYPRRRPSSIFCSFTIPIKDSHTLLLETVTEDGEFPLGLRLLNVLRDGQRLSDISKMGEVILHGNTSKSLEIQVDFRWKRRYLYGFMLPFKGILESWKIRLERFIY